MISSRYWTIRQIFEVSGVLVSLFLIGKSDEVSYQQNNAKGATCPYAAVAGYLAEDSNIFNLYKDKNTTLKKSSLDRIAILQPYKIKNTYCAKDVQPGVDCDASSPYRNLDGSCNNLKNPTWGMVNECQVRFLPPYYSDDGEYRKSVSGAPLPAPRNLSLGVFSDADRPEKSTSQIFVFFGQFVAHDFTEIPTPTGNVDSCCPFDARNQARPECSPVFIDRDDPFYSKYNVTCNSFERAVHCEKCVRSCDNEATAALDLSHVYGKSEHHSNLLRMKDGTGRLRFELQNGVAVLPRDNESFSFFCPHDQLDQCFLAGDDRADMHSTLTSLQTLLLREHNRVAEMLKEMNPHWQEERIFQEARKIVGGQWHNIVFDEYLPLLLGPRHMTHFRLWVGEGPGSGHRSLKRIGTWIEVTGAGFRLHSEISAQLGVRDLRFYETSENPGLIRSGCAETLLRGACRAPAQKIDRHFTKDVSEYFLKEPTKDYGKDILTVDIQRGRDLGMPPYTVMLDFLTDGQIKITDFDDLRVLMSKKHVKILKRNYDSVEDVDLWVGLQLEKRPPGSVLGFSAASLVGMQFHSHKYGDRFYFENDQDAATAFTRVQVEALRSSSLSRWLCDNADARAIQKNAFLLPSIGKPVLDCNDIPKIDLTPWKEDSGSGR